MNYCQNGVYVLCSLQVISQGLLDLPIDVEWLPFICGLQGIVHWQPPVEALKEVEEAVQHPTVSKYGADDGMPELRQALLEKVH